jgi:hypothetical protein
MDKLGGGAVSNEIAPGLVARFSFSQKPACGYYADYYEKMTAYAAMLTAQPRASILARMLARTASRNRNQMSSRPLTTSIRLRAARNSTAPQRN